ncbi:HTH domain-containing protein [Parabacteroides sp. Marseille-P3160]|uniref:HTH domain-containing protein n=1 Tax=Parabacteroides sp. Marseille-P3160 TaxID=1917887 RepID=UPI0011183221
MHLFETLDRLKRIHRLIQNRETGNPCKFAERLHLSRRQLYNVLEELKSFGAEIRYSRMEESFFYENDFQIEIKIGVSLLNSSEKMNVLGGKSLFSSVQYYYTECL